MTKAAVVASSSVGARFLHPGFHSFAPATLLGSGFRLYLNGRKDVC